MAIWPLTLPAPAINTFSESPPDNTMRSSTDKGPAKTRRRTTANVRPVSFTLNLTDAQAQTLDDFYVNTTYSGADEFTFTHPRTDAIVSARFTQPPQYGDREATVWSVSIALEIMP